MGLSEAARSVWAKSADEDGAWLPLWQHMDDSADVAAELFERWLAPSVVRLLAAEFGDDIDQARAAVGFLAGIHDLGKATPAFAVQDVNIAQRMREHGLYMASHKSELVDRHLAHHSVAGHHLLVRWLRDQGWSRRIARTWGVVLGGHHGVTPDSSAEKAAKPDELPELYGRGTWLHVQREFIDRMVTRTGAEAWLAKWRDIKLSAQFQVLATALVIMSDWIASNKDLLPFHAKRLPEPRSEPRRVRDALATLRLPSPWAPAPYGGDVSELFARRFSLPAGARPRPVQAAMFDVAHSMSEPGLLIAEAPMGEGKTEGALAASEVMAARFGAGGVMIALPTQATTDAMFHRVVDWLDAMGARDEQVGGSIMLGHGKARFNRVYQGLVRAGKLAEIGRDDTAVRCGHAVSAHAWLSGRKKAQLANFAIVTIDQLLFVGLRARHLMLRHLALAGKVVVIDEIHAYDAYMNSYLSTVLTWLGAYRVPVIALSATLPAQQRRELIEAYERGRDGSGHDHLDRLDGDIGYPALTWTEGNAISTRVVEPSGRRTSVAVEALTNGADDLDELSALLRDLLSDGGCALVVRNTVRRVLATAEQLEREFPGEITVAHSRFIAADRMGKDTELLDMFGAPDRAKTRPRRAILVASQVVEQSLDVDFDVLVTDLAPMDLVLQRTGRLHRHERGRDQSGRPPKLRSARVYVAGADFSANPPELESSAARYVYGEHTLFRSAAVLRGRFGSVIELPDDIALLVQEAYGPHEIGPESWRDTMAAAREKWQRRVADREDKARDFQIMAPGNAGEPITGWMSAAIGEADDEAQGQGQVRDGAPSLEAILLCEGADGEWRTPAWLPEGRGGLTIPRDETPSVELAEIMASCVLRLPLAFSNADAETALWDATPPAWELSPLIYRQPVLIVDDDGWGRINERPVRYTVEKGLEVFDSDE